MTQIGLMEPKGMVAWGLLERLPALPACAQQGVPTRPCEEVPAHGAWSCSAQRGKEQQSLGECSAEDRGGPQSPRAQ